MLNRFNVYEQLKQRSIGGRSNRNALPGSRVKRNRSLHPSTTPFCLVDRLKYTRNISATKTIDLAFDLCHFSWATVHYNWEIVDLILNSELQDGGQWPYRMPWRLSSVSNRRQYLQMTAPCSLYR